MAIDAKDEHLIEKHLFGQLSTEEEALFKTRLEDEDFAEELDFHKCLKNACKMGGKKHCEKLRRSKQRAISQLQTPSGYTFLGIFKTLVIGYLVYTILKWIF